jgi:dTDP-glucose 4,6-dehydratase
MAKSNATTIRNEKMIIVVTGGRGFIGSHFVELALSKNHTIIDIDKCTYSANQTLPWDHSPNYTLIKQDINDITHLPTCDVLINFAAESHVDNSIKSPSQFIHSNINGVFNLLELIRGKTEYDRPLFFQISTDEVYGDIISGSFYENSILKPSNPYAASKAAAEMLVLSYHRTYGIKYLISRCSNNYGARQFEEKLMAKTLKCIKNNKPIPIHGDGSYIRDWIYVKDHAEALMFLIESNKSNFTINISANTHLSNLEVVKTILAWENINIHQSDHYHFVPNRWGQDLRYSISNKKILSMGWEPKHSGYLYKWY